MIFNVLGTQRYFGFLLLKQKRSMSEFPVLFSIYYSFKILLPFVSIQSLSGLTLLKIWGRFYAPPGICTCVSVGKAHCACRLK